MEVILGMLFLALSNTDIKFTELVKLTGRPYTIAETLPTIKRFELIDKQEFAKAALDENFEIFVVHITALEVLTAMSIHSPRAF